MNKSGENHFTSFRRILLLSLFLCLYALIDRFPQYYGMGSLLGHFSGSRLMQISPVIVLAVVDGLMLIISAKRSQPRLQKFIDAILVFLRKLRAVNGLIFSGLALVFPMLVLSTIAPEFDFMLPRIWIFGHLILLGSLFLRATTNRINDLMVIVVTAIVYAMIERLALFIPEISAQMTSLGWSEASRYYYASLFFSKSIYGSSTPLPSLHPSRYLLQSFPFMIAGLPLWVHRAWQVILWVALPLTGCLLIVRRLKIKSTLISILVILWGYLFLNQGPVYYHLMVCVILVAGGFSVNKPIKSMVFVILASIWAGISRINWFPVPGLLAVFFYILEVPQFGISLKRYWLWPTIWAVIGLITAFLSEAIYVLISGNPVENFGTSFTSSLLWYRLFPNMTYPNGILLSILLVSLPGVILIVSKLARERDAMHPMRGMTFGLILLVFFAGGIVVSVKIGGGSNLHNLDAFLVFFMVSVVYLFFDWIKPEQAAKMHWRSIHWIVTALLIFSPIINVIQADSQFVRFDNNPVQQDLRKLQTIIDSTPITDGEILFITQRHFMTFRYVTRVNLVSDYEKVFLMEMAMAGNEEYLHQFEADLKQHRFSLIVSEPLSMVIMDEQDVFFEENNAYVTQITASLRKYYRESVILPNALIAILEPIPSSGK
jgi:hypothetical protein